MIGADLEDIILVVDECHNLIDTVLQLNSVEFSFNDIEYALKELRGKKNL